MMLERTGSVRARTGLSRRSVEYPVCGYHHLIRAEPSARRLEHVFIPVLTPRGHRRGTVHDGTGASCQLMEAVSQL